MYQNLLQVDWDLGLSVTISGVVIVFGMLLLLVAVLSVFGLVAKSANKTAKTEKKVEVKPAQKTNPAPAVVTPSATATTDNNEIIAVIAAAVATMYDGSDVKPVIRRIIKAPAGGRPAWTAAGIFENTRSF